MLSKIHYFFVFNNQTKSITFANRKKALFYHLNLLLLITKNTPEQIKITFKIFLKWHLLIIR